ncbi:MAG: LysR family transcriptional regulator [Planctomycetia bacterium]|nr:LysR family transcriptional regulator [Planctomycetia bacterium]
MSRTDRYKDIQLPQLRSFCLAATEGNFTTAAKILGISAPTVWQQVRALERRLKTTLLRRRGRHVELTPQGKMLLGLVQPHVSGLDSIEPLFVAQQQLLPQQLVVASIPYLVSSYLVEPVREFGQAHPAVQLKLHVCVWFDEVARMVEQGQADLGVLFYDRDQPRSPHLMYERLFDLRFALLTPTDHPLARKKRILPDDVIEYPWIVPPDGSFARRSLMQFLHRHHLDGQAHIILETALLDIIKKYVAVGVGIGFAHIAEQGDPMPGIHIRYFDARREGIAVAVVFRKGAHRTALAQDFSALLRRLLGDAAPADDE